MTDWELGQTADRQLFRETDEWLDDHFPLHLAEEDEPEPKPATDFVGFAESIEDYLTQLREAARCDDEATSWWLVQQIQIRADMMMEDYPG